MFRASSFSSSRSARRLGAALLAGVLALPAAAHDATQHAASRHGAELFKPGLPRTGSAVAEGLPPLYDGLDAVHRAVTTAEPRAQAYFDQGLALYWGFNHAEAVRSFRAAQALDPACAMCAWGEALALGPNINQPMPAAAIRPAWEAIGRAAEIMGRATPKERALIGALRERYAPTALTDRRQLDRAWARATAELAVAFPGDADILVLYAEALMNLQPWDYWEADGLTAKGDGATIVAVLERAMALAPAHPGALHLYIHAVEASAEPERAEAAADRLRGLVPGAGHLVHMPAHIYMRLGRHADVLAVNREAVAADETFLAAAGEAASPLYRFGYYPHNVHFLLNAAQMAGLKADAVAAAEKLATVTSDQVSAELGWVQAIRTAPYVAHALMSEPAEILALPDPGGRMPYVQGFWHYARGVARALAGEAALAEAEAAAISRLIATADFSGLEAQGLAARTVLGVARDVVTARAFAVRGDWRAAEAALASAMAGEARIGYMEPPFWPIPVVQTRGAVELAQGRAEAAAASFRTALAQSPRNGWSLWGLAQAERAMGLDASATEAALDAAWLGDRALLSLERL